jgi:hypothetical protein
VPSASGFRGEASASLDVFQCPCAKNFSAAFNAGHEVVALPATRQLIRGRDLLRGVHASKENSREKILRRDSRAGCDALIVFALA